MAVLSFDIETFFDRGTLLHEDFTYLRARAGKQDAPEDDESCFSFNPFLIRPISIAYASIEDDKITDISVDYISGAEEDSSLFEDADICFTSISLKNGFDSAERELLERFWERVETAEGLVSFNGRSFDANVIKIRSLIHHLIIHKDISGTRYPRWNSFHVDLADILGGDDSRNRFNFDFLCRHLGIPSPKGEMDGSKVQAAFQEKRHFTIAKYNARDAEATAQLYLQLRSCMPYLSDAAGRSGEPITEKQKAFLIELLAGATKENKVQLGLWLDQEMSLTKDKASAVIELLSGFQRRNQSKSGVSLS